MVKDRLKQDGKFKFGFNSSEAVEDDEELVEHMAEIEKLVRRLAKGSTGRMTFKFLKIGSSLRVR